MNDYNAQRERTMLADAAHAKMLDWYSIQLGVARSDVSRKLSSLTSERARQLYTQYLEQL